MICQTHPLGTLDTYKYVVVLSEYRGMWLLSRHRDRVTWETQGGHIEPGETPLDAARRELYEESGAADFEIRAAFDYYAADDNGYANGMVFLAHIRSLAPIPDSEMAEVRTFDDLPSEEILTYPGITPVLFRHAVMHDQFLCQKGDTPMNPIVNGWYADPEARFYEGKYYIYVTRSFTKYEDQMNIDAFSSADLIHWEKHESIIDMSGYPYVHRAVWAPTIIEKNGKYYLMFATNDIHVDDEGGGLEIAVSDSPAGPFVNLLGTSLISKIIYGAQPIDAHLFKDDDGTIYLYYGGWGHCNMAIMNETMDGFVPFEDGEIFRSITPDGYVEGPCMMKRNGVYHFMWSEGGWTNGTYHVASSHSLSPTDICKTGKTVLSSSEIANGPGHHGYLHVEGTEDDWLIVYHRRIIGDLEAGHRMLCIDRMTFDGDEIVPVVMT